ncbi:hypothetical protein AAFN88_21160 [Pelagibius sp. CAU 1746]|uniref:hypothetical protein n=1 Tax=Pelagibius sp. CAU 1746 TaxID=3140370 RepID=UPI00325B232E
MPVPAPLLGAAFTWEDEPLLPLAGLLDLPNAIFMTPWDGDNSPLPGTVRLPNLFNKRILLRINIRKIDNRPGLPRGGFRG